MRTLFLLLFPFSLTAQFTYTIDQSIPVQVNDKILVNAWAGGVNSPEINTMDLDADGISDLIIYDKTADKVLTFLARNGSYRYTPDYEIFFPAEINTFLVLRDYNCDGKKDLFTFGQIGLLVFQNVTQAGKNLTWKKLTFYNSDTGLKSEVLLTRSDLSQKKINLLPGTNDLPNFSDMDGDGDLDIMNMKFVSPSTAEYHKNFSMERYGRCDSLDFERQTQNWGGFEECSCGVIAFGKECFQIGGRTEHTGGKALLALDMDNDGDKDLIFSEETCTRLYYMQNQGTASNPLLTNAAIFPASTPAGIFYYPAPYLEDVDFDGKSDLLVSPNLYTRSQFTNDVSRSLWFYKNTGTNQLPNFTYVKNNFIQEDMIDVGDFSAPAFIDIDNDGDQDLFIGKFLDNNFGGSVSYYQNTGTRSQPSFKLVTDDYLGLSLIGMYNFKVQFVDLDRNGGPDFVFSGTRSQNGRTSLYYLPSSSSTTFVYSGGQIQPINFAMDINENVTFVDVDQDGNLDILTGTSTGSLEFWRNIGATNYSLVTNKYLGLGDSPVRQTLAVAVGDLDSDGRQDLVAGDQLGNLYVYADFRNAGANPQAVTSLIYDSFSKSYVSKNMGGKLRPAVVNLHGADKPEIIVGNTMGGLSALKNDSGQASSDKPQLNIFPNPLSTSQSLSIQSDRNGVLEFFTLLGQHIGTPVSMSANQIVSYPLLGFAPGAYIARFTAGSRVTGKQFIIVE